LLTSAYLYSAPPARLKEKPLLDSIANGFMIFGAFVIGYSFGGTLTQISYKWYLLGLAAMGIHAFTTIMDYTPDKAAGYRTFAIYFGKRPTSIFAAAAFAPFIICVETTALVRSILAISCGLMLLSFVRPSEALARIIFRICYVNLIVVAALGLILLIRR
jgi:4-hydroxybenzoate polyprenyltransferase